MCMGVFSGPYKAVIDITVFKVVRKRVAYRYGPDGEVTMEPTLHAVFHDFEYQLGTTYKTELDVRSVHTEYDPLSANNREFWVDDESESSTRRYFGFMDSKEAQYWQNATGAQQLHKVVFAGFHGATVADRLYKLVEDRDDAYLGNGYLAECTIPAGSTYYHGHDHLIVSDQLRIDRVIDGE